MTIMTGWYYTKGNQYATIIFSSSLLHNKTHTFQPYGGKRFETIYNILIKRTP